MPGTIELIGQADFPPCACCGVPPRRVWGNLIDADGTTAYVVQWAPGTHGTHAAVIGLIFGAWGDGSRREDRSHVAVECRPGEDGLQLMIIDAAGSPVDATSLAATALRRNQVIDGPLQARVFNYVEQIRVQDGRVGGLIGA